MAHRRRVAPACTLLAVLSLLLGAPLWITLPTADSAGSVVSSEARDRVLREGRVRVIAEMRLPGGSHVPEGLLTAAAQTVQRQDIAGARLRILTRLAGHSHRVLHQYSTVPYVALEVGPDALTELEASSLWVKRVVVDTVNTPSLPQSVPLIGADQAWSRGFDGTGMVVAIVDTGVEAGHPFFSGRVVEEACYSSNVSGISTTVCPNGSTQQIGPGSGAPCPVTDCWHGTHVAGIAAGNGAGAGVGFSGVAKGAQIMAVQVFSKFIRSVDCGGAAPCALAWTSDIIAGLERVYALRGVRSLASANLSLGGGTFTSPCDGDPLKPIIDNLRSARIATVVAAGNDGTTNAISSPACISSAISVGATTKTDVVASYSNVSSFMSLYAPGSSIYSSVTGGMFGIASGTSMATPHVTGAWAVLKQAVPSASVDQILSALQTTGLPVSETSGGVTITKPRIRVDQALSALVPTLTSIAPNQGAVGATVTVTLNGSGFTAGMTVSVGAGIAVSNVNVGSATQLTATLTIASGATPGARDVTVSSTGGGSGTLAGGFTVTSSGSVTLNAPATIAATTPASASPPGFGLTMSATLAGKTFAAGTLAANYRFRMVEIATGYVNDLLVAYGTATPSAGFAYVRNGQYDISVSLQNSAGVTLVDTSGAAATVGPVRVTVPVSSGTITLNAPATIAATTPASASPPGFGLTMSATLAGKTFAGGTLAANYRFRMVEIATGYVNDLLVAYGTATPSAGFAYVRNGQYDISVSLQNSAGTTLVDTSGAPATVGPVRVTVPVP